jgi:hypothetical protein
MNQCPIPHQSQRQTPYQVRIPIRKKVKISAPSVLSSFTFSSPWTQKANTVYYVRPRYTGSPEPFWYVKTGQSLTNGSCHAQLCPSKLVCGVKASLQVVYNKTSCCPQGCYHGGSCLSSGNCSCPFPYSGNKCLCAKGFSEINGTCQESKKKKRK